MSAHVSARAAGVTQTVVRADLEPAGAERHGQGFARCVADGTQPSTGSSGGVLRALVAEAASHRARGGVCVRVWRMTREDGSVVSRI
jgi:hypothetical protein